MGKYFADVHASHESQFQDLPHGLADTDEIRACRAKPQTYETLLELADALCWQLRFREAIDALTQAVRLEPERMEAYRKRGPKYLDTLQFEQALADYTRCEQADGVSVMSRYRVGMAQYMLQNYAAATAAFAGSLAIAPQDDDMYIADVYWLVLSQLRAGKVDDAQKTLQQHYRPDMYVGHHTAYEKAMRVAAGAAQMEDILATLDEETDDLQFAMTAYGLCVLLEAADEREKADALREKLLARGGFWFCFSYLAAYHDHALRRGRGRVPAYLLCPSRADAQGADIPVAPAGGKIHAVAQIRK